MKRRDGSRRPGAAARLGLIGMLLVALQSTVSSETRIAVLDFQLNDLTLLPGNQKELERTASIGPMLEDALRGFAQVQIVEVDPAAAREADAALGYLFDHSEVAARLGATYGADWILVGRLHKPSFLFAYLMARLVDTRTGKVAEDIVVEIKGTQPVVTRKGVLRLAEKLKARIDAGPGPTPDTP